MLGVPGKPGASEDVCRKLGVLLFIDDYSSEIRRLPEENGSQEKAKHERNSQHGPAVGVSGHTPNGD